MASNEESNNGIWPSFAYSIHRYDAGYDIGEDQACLI